MRRNIIFAAAALLVVSVSASAIPARKGKIIKTLPNGTKVEVELHGDEFCHWMTSGGTIVKQDKDGNLVPSSTYEIKVRMGGSEEVNANRMKNLERTRNWSKPATRASGTDLHFPLILVQFSNLSFTIADTEQAVYQAFYNLANQEGYSENGATGSIRDFYIDNSLNQLSISFDVFGPVTLSNRYSYYGTEDNYGVEPAPEALYQALQKVYAEQTAAGNSDPFAKYDNDGDGTVDAILMFYAGYNEAEGGDEDTIWPHEWTFSAWDKYKNTSYASSKFGSVKFNTYSCTSEFKGYSGEEMCGIGTGCHEFGHALGLPDFYDTNYNDYNDGYAGALYEYSTMCSGSYNNDGRTPPYFTVEERMLMGWMSGYETMPSSGEITINPVNENFGYKEATSTTNEYFAFECRSGQGWDAYVPAGLVVYHVDKSSNQVTYNTSSNSSSTRTASSLWTNYTQYINASGTHPCYYIIPASDQENLYFNSGYTNDKMPFPGAGGYTFYKWQGWSSSNKQSDWFYDIKFNSSTGTVTMQRGSSHTDVSGVITTTSGNVIPGATVALYAAYSNVSTSKVVTKSSGPKKISGAVGSPLLSTVTGNDGTYSLNLEDIDESTVYLVVNAPGYVEKSVTITPESGEFFHQNVVLRGITEPINYTLKKFDSNFSSLYLFGTGNANSSLMVSARLTPDDLGDYLGRQLLSLGFAYASETVSAAYGIVDFATAGESSFTRKATVQVSSPEEYVWQEVDLSSKNIYVEDNTDIYIGYALNKASDEYQVLREVDSIEGDGMYYASFSTSSTSSWTDYSDYGNILVYLVLDDKSYLEYNHISDPKLSTYELGDTLDLELITVSGERKPGSAISWFYDDEPVSGTSITFTKSGYHTIGAKFTTTSGNSKVIELEIVVED